ncbi:MAG: SpoIID/LytB domain-containing protein [Deinococcales bacterium]
MSLERVNFGVSSALGTEMRLEPLDASFVRWHGRDYRGAIWIVAEGNKLLIINVIDMESYLRGVVPMEMNSEWHLEALKAQAVAARTYAIREMTRRNKHPYYDLCASIECQVYEGVAVENERSDTAIRATQGLILTYQGRIAETPYHADSGGTVASSLEVWNQDIPYLSVKSDFDSKSPFKAWHYDFDAKEISQDLKAYQIGDVYSLSIQSISPSQRVIAMEVKGSLGTISLAGRELQDNLRKWGLKSTRFKLISPLSAEGSGAGHGVGLSQYGARALAESAYGFADILDFYYPQTDIVPYGESQASY